MGRSVRLRWVWHLGIFVALVLVLAKSALLSVFFANRDSDPVEYLIDKILRFAVYFVAICPGWSQRALENTASLDQAFSPDREPQPLERRDQRRKPPKGPSAGNLSKTKTS
jgi:hypothetical protein